MISILVGLALLGLTAGAVASAARPSSIVSLLLGSYVAAWSALVISTTLLSVAGSVGRTGLLASLAVAAILASLAWRASGRSRPPSMASGAVEVRAAFRDPVIALLAATVLLAAGYLVVLGTATPQNEWDSLTYHLSRAAFWLQQGSVSYVPGVVDVRINGNPPVAEIGQLAALALNGSERFVWLPQFTGGVALCLAAFGIARRAGLETRDALFGALVLACLPLVLLQASTALNDLLVASFLTVATYFALGRTRRSATAAAVALALGVGTKVVALFLLPLYLAVVLVSRRRAPLAQVVIVIAGGALGSVWYVVNLVQTGVWDGGLGSAGNQIPDRAPLLVLSRIVQLVTNALELPGAVGSDVLVYPVVAGAFLAVVVVVSLRRRRSVGASPFATAAVVALVPVAIWCLARGTTWAWRRAWVASGRTPDSTSIPAHFSPSRFVDSTGTWFGAVGILMVICGVVLAVRRPDSDRPLRIACAVGPLALLVVVAVAVPYDPWRGRFFFYAMALASVAWGLAFATRPLAWAIALTSVVTVPLTLVHSYPKPPGIRLLEPAAHPSVFGQPRWKVQTWIRQGDGTDAAVRFVEQHVPADATIGLALGINDFVSPYFGEHLHRTVRLVPRGAAAPAGATWLVEAPNRSVPSCSASWQTVLSTGTGYRVLRRTHPDRCEQAQDAAAAG